MNSNENTYNGNTHVMGGGEQPNLGEAIPISNSSDSESSKDSDFLSKTALILAILSLSSHIGVPFSITAVICAIIALRRNIEDKCALASLIIGCIAILMSIRIAALGMLGDALDEIQARRGAITGVAGMTYYVAKDNIQDISSIERNRTVTIFLSDGKEIKMPDIVGLIIEQAEELPADIDIEIKIREAYNEETDAEVK